MNFSRRRLLGAGLSLLALTVKAGEISRPRPDRLSPPPPDLDPDRFRKALERELSGSQVGDSEDVILEAPDTAEDGAVVPVRLESRVPATDRLVLFVERNPDPLIAAFEFSGTALPRVSTRIKISESSAVILLARAGGRYYRTTQRVRVVRGGCG